MTKQIPRAAALLVCVALNYYPAASLDAQRAASAVLRIVGPAYTTATGALRVPASEEEIQLQAALVNREGIGNSLGGCTARWSSSAPEILRIVRVSDDGRNA
jgi:hypothetical protein